MYERLLSFHSCRITVHVPVMISKPRFRLLALLTGRYMRKHQFFGLAKERAYSLNHPIPTTLVPLKSSRSTETKLQHPLIANRARTMYLTY
jgi:hypothetical protein